MSNVFKWRNGLIPRGRGFESRLRQELSTTEVRPLSKAPNPQLLPGHRSVGCPLLQVCVCNPPGSAPTHRAGREPGTPVREAGALTRPLASVTRAPHFEVRGVRFYTQPLPAYIRYTHPPKPHSHPADYANVTPPTRVRTHSPSGSRTRDSGAGGGRSNKERQRLQPLASVTRAPHFEVRGVRFYTQPLPAYIRYMCTWMG